MNRPFDFVGLYWGCGPAPLPEVASQLARMLPVKTEANTTNVGGPGWFLHIRRSGSGAGDSIITDESGRTALIGTLFDAQGLLVPGDPGRITPEAAAKALDTCGVSLAKSCWGRYVGFLGHPTEPDLVILCHPHSNLKVFYIAVGDVTWFASRPDLLLRASGARFEPNWAQIAAFIAYTAPVSGHTAIAGVSELLPGEALMLHAGRRTSKRFWCVEEFIADRDLDYQAAAEELTALLANVTRCWASVSDGALMELSGGLDSSAVLAFLNETAPDLETVCVNYFSSSATQQDERRHAEALAKKTRSRLFPLDTDNPDLVSIPGLGGTPGMLLPRPVPEIVTLGVLRRVNALAKEAKCRTVWSGAGGDAVMIADPYGCEVADHWRGFGIRGTLGVAENIAACKGDTLWRVLSTSAGAFFRMPSDLLSTRLPPRNDSHRYFNQDLLRLAEGAQTELPHLGVLKRRPGRAAQLAGILFTLRGHNDSNWIARDEGLGWVAPLLSQPVIEWAMSIPLHLFFKDGLDRYPLRLAASSRIGSAVAMRRWKGEATGAVIRTIVHKREQVMDVLANGALAGCGLLNVSRFREVLGRPQAERDVEVWNVLMALVAELWFAPWSEGRVGVG